MGRRRICYLKDSSKNLSLVQGVGGKLDKEGFEKAVKLFYEMAGWDSEGKPSRAKLYELGLGWIVKG